MRIILTVFKGGRSVLLARLCRVSCLYVGWQIVPAYALVMACGVYYHIYYSTPYTGIDFLFMHGVCVYIGADFLLMSYTH